MIYIIAENIKKHRKLKGYTQKQLGEKIGKSDMTVRKYESAYIMPSDSCLDDICKALEISRGDILLNEKDKKEMVNHPSHYNMGKYECLDVVKELVKDMKGIEATLFFNAFKYLWRYKQKNGLQDLKKCEFYLKELISLNEGYQE